MLYRAESGVHEVEGERLALSSIGLARSADGVHFAERRQILQPEHPWERFGCEDPRVTAFEGRYYIFYTSLSVHPFEATGIRVGLAITSDFERFEKHPVTPFNAKAMALFPGRVKGKIAAVLTPHTDMPPAKVCLALFDRIEDLWSASWWADWYGRLDEHVIALLRGPEDQVEVGAPPLQTDRGWLLVYSDIRGYFGPRRRFTVAAALLDTDEPRRTLGRTVTPLMEAEAEYERHGAVESVVFPSAAVVEGEELRVYYGGADTCSCMARMPLAPLLDELTRRPLETFVPSAQLRQGFQRFSGNPILVPRAELRWQARAVFNPAALRLHGQVHLIYRAMSLDGTSTFGLAVSDDGLHFDDRPGAPVYAPAQPFEMKLRPGNSGCEDPRLTLLDDWVYMFYTAFDGFTPRVAWTRLGVEDFLARRWRWEPARVITPPGVDDKDGCLLPRRLAGDYVVFHRFGDAIRVNTCPSLDFGPGRWLNHESRVILPRTTTWDNRKFGAAAPPLETPYGWLMLFHRVTRTDSIYKVEAMLLDRDDPGTVLADTGASLLEPEMPYEREGQTRNVVFPCGAVIMDDEVMLYYGAGDSVIGVARMGLGALYKRLGL